MRSSTKHLPRPPIHDVNANVSPSRKRDGIDRSCSADWRNKGGSSRLSRRYVSFEPKLRVPNLFVHENDEIIHCRGWRKEHHIVKS
jgi:hypothetical protein